MKIIDRVIFCLTNNDKYIGFWNYISKLYREKYDTIPTLMFSGSTDELNNLITSGQISTKFGEIICLSRVDNILYDQNLDWTCTWGLFYGASLFPNDICMLSGIDQIPLNDCFYKKMKDLDVESEYIVAFSDGYDHPGASYPSAHHVGYGKYYKEIYEIENEWKNELNKIYSFRNKWFESSATNFWGMDEAYSTFMINEYIASNKNIKINLVKNFSKEWRVKKLDRAHGVITVNEQLLSLIKNGYFNEYHSVRPFSLNENMDKIYDAIPSVNNTRK